MICPASPPASRQRPCRILAVRDPALWRKTNLCGDDGLKEQLRLQAEDDKNFTKNFVLPSQGDAACAVDIVDDDSEALLAKLTAKDPQDPGKRVRYDAIVLGCVAGFPMDHGDKGKTEKFPSAKLLCRFPVLRCCTPAVSWCIRDEHVDSLLVVAAGRCWSEDSEDSADTPTKRTVTPTNGILHTLDIPRGEEYTLVNEEGGVGDIKDLEPHLMACKPTMCKINDRSVLSNHPKLRRRLQAWSKTVSTLADDLSHENAKLRHHLKPENESSEVQEVCCNKDPTAEGKSTTTLGITVDRCNVWVYPEPPSDWHYSAIHKCFPSLTPEMYGDRQVSLLDTYFAPFSQPKKENSREAIKETIRSRVKKTWEQLHDDAEPANGDTGTESEVKRVPLTGSITNSITREQVRWFRNDEKQRFLGDYSKFGAEGDPGLGGAWWRECHRDSGDLQEHFAKNGSCFVVAERRFGPEIVDGAVKTDRSQLRQRVVFWHDGFSEYNLLHPEYAAKPWAKAQRAAHDARPSCVLRPAGKDQRWWWQTLVAEVAAHFSELADEGLPDFSTSSGTGLDDETQYDWKVQKCAYSECDFELMEYAQNSFVCPKCPAGTPPFYVCDRYCQKNFWKEHKKLVHRGA